MRSRQRTQSKAVSAWVSSRPSILHIAHPARRAYHSDGGSYMRALCLTISLLLPAFAQREDLPKAPTDVKPGSITYDEVAYPHTVAYVPGTLSRQCARIASM